MHLSTDLQFLGGALYSMHDCGDFAENWVLLGNYYNFLKEVIFRQCRHSFKLFKELLLGLSKR